MRHEVVSEEDLPRLVLVDLRWSLVVPWVLLQGLFRLRIQEIVQSAGTDALEVQLFIFVVLTHGRTLILFGDRFVTRGQQLTQGRVHGKLAHLQWTAVRCLHQEL